MPSNDSIRNLPRDLTASVAVFLVALPLSLGVALASDAPLFSGLIAAIVGGLVVGLISRSHLSVSGPAAGLAAVVADALSRLPSYEAFLAALVVCGVLQIGLGYLRAGFLADLVPGSVIKGLLAGIGILLILIQVPHLLGDDSHYEIDESTRQWPADKGSLIGTFFAAFLNPTPVAAAIGLAGLATHVLLKRLAAWRPSPFASIPSPIAIIASGIGLHLAIRTMAPGQALEASHLVSLPVLNSARDLGQFLTHPDWRQLLNPEVLSLGLVLALLASLESLLSIEAIDDTDPFQRVTPPNRELKAQGIGNLVCGLVGGLPVTSAIVRSSVNVNAGARTRMATVYHGLLILAAVVAAPGIVNLIPKASLAAVLVVIGFDLARPSLFAHYLRLGRVHFLPFAATILAILLTDLLVGVLIGIGVGLYFVLRSNFHNSVTVVSDGNKYLFRFRKEVSFLNKPVLKASLESVAPGSQVYIDTSRADFIDPDVVDIIEDFMLHAPLSDITVDLRTRPGRSQGFSPRLLEPHAAGPTLVRGRDAEIHAVPAR